MEKEKILKILEDYEYFVDDDWGGHYEHINCKQRAFTPLGILEILDYIDNLETQLKKQKEVIDKAIKYINSSDICIDIRKTDGSLDYVSTNELLDILNEV